MLSSSFVPLPLHPDPRVHPPTSHFYLFCCHLTRQDFVFPGIPPFYLWREGRKEDEGLKVCGVKFLEDVSGLCSQGTSCSQCEHGTLSMGSISMTIIFILQQSGSRQHSTTGGKKSFFQFDTLCNILAVNTNRAMREKIMTRYQPSSGVTNSRSSFTKCPVELSSVSAPNFRLRTSDDRSLSTAQCCGKCNIWWLSEIQRVGQVRCCSKRHFSDVS